MILYHGSYTEITKPDISFSRLNLDFGKGFYTTPIYEQAKKWSERNRKKYNKGVISTFEIDENIFDKLNVLAFDSYSEEWLDFILKCRQGKDDSNYDLVIGGIANDKVFNTIELFFDGLIDKSEAIKRLKFEKPNIQYAFKSQKSIDFLIYKGSETI